MHIAHVQLSGIRCFDDTGRVRLSKGCNLFVGQNNSGKSTILRSALALQGFDFSKKDMRPNSPNSYFRIGLSDVQPADRVANRPTGKSDFIVDRIFRGGTPKTGIDVVRMNSGSAAFEQSRPNHHIVPFLAKRKAPAYDQSVTSSAQGAVTGTYQHLVARVDTLATAGHPHHQRFVNAVSEIIGIPITTKAAQNGKECGFYLDANEFIALERMGDGVTELVAHIVELVLERGKIFVLEEPESFLHPRALKALLSLIREAAMYNQFLIATHSNIVLRELAVSENARIFRVTRTSNDPWSPSTITLVPTTPAAHRDILRELGYEFADFGLHEAWLFFEEASAESVFRDILIPLFEPQLMGRLRTFSAAGASNLEPTVSEFTRLITFIHLQPAYMGRMWVCADNDEAGTQAIEALAQKFDHLTHDNCRTFDESAFERYFPQAFAARAAEALRLPNKVERRNAKAMLLDEVLKWSAEHPDEAKLGWQESAKVPLEFLHEIAEALRGH